MALNKSWIIKSTNFSLKSPETKSKLKLKTQLLDEVKCQSSSKFYSTSSLNVYFPNSLIDKTSTQSRNRLSSLLISKSTQMEPSESENIFQNPAIKKVVCQSKEHRNKQLNKSCSICPCKIEQLKTNALLKKIKYNQRLRVYNRKLFHNLYVLPKDKQLNLNNLSVKNNLSKNVLEINGKFISYFNQEHQPKSNSIKLIYPDQIHGIYFKGKTQRLKNLINQRLQKEDLYNNLSFYNKINFKIMPYISKKIKQYQKY